MATRPRRQELLTKPSPLELSVVMDESALLRNFGGKRVMIDHLHRIVEVMQLPNVTVHVLALEGRHSVHSAAPFILLRSGKIHDVTLHDAVHIADRLQRLPDDAFGELSDFPIEGPLGDGTLRLG